MSARVPSRKQYESLRVLARLATALVPSRKEFVPLIRKGWTEADLRLPAAREGAMGPQRITPAGLRALADAMERYEGEGGDA